MPPKEATHSTLLDLPAELRVQIYDSVYDHDDIYDFYLVNKAMVETYGPRALKDYALLQTCKVVHREASRVAYSKAVFQYTLYSALAQKRDTLGHVKTLKFMRLAQNIVFNLRSARGYAWERGIFPFDGLLSVMAENEDHTTTRCIVNLAGTEHFLALLEVEWPPSWIESFRQMCLKRMDRLKGRGKLGSVGEEFYRQILAIITSSVHRPRFPDP